MKTRRVPKSADQNAIAPVDGVDSPPPVDKPKGRKPKS